MKQKIIQSKHFQKNMQRVKDLIQKIIKALPKIIFISKIFALVFLVISSIIYIVGVFQAIGETPHYYVDIEADANIKNTDVYQQYVQKVISGGNESIAQAAISLATVDEMTGGGRINFTGGGFRDVERFAGNSRYTVDTFLKVMPQIKEIALNLQSSGKRNGRWTWEYDMYASCDLAVSSAILWSGSDDEFPMYLDRELRSPTHRGISGYLVNDPNDKWEEVPKGSDVMPGDIAINTGHVWMYVAEWSANENRWVNNDLVQEKYPNSKSVRYEGSFEDYYPKLATDGSPWESGADYIFRFKGEGNPDSPFLNIQN